MDTQGGWLRRFEPKRSSVPRISLYLMCHLLQITLLTQRIIQTFGKGPPVYRVTGLVSYIRFIVVTAVALVL